MREVYEHKIRVFWNLNFENGNEREVEGAKEGSRVAWKNDHDLSYVKKHVCNFLFLVKFLIDYFILSFKICHLCSLQLLYIYIYILISILIFYFLISNLVCTYIYDYKNVRVTSIKVYS